MLHLREFLQDIVEFLLAGVVLFMVELVLLLLFLFSHENYVIITKFKFNVKVPGTIDRSSTTEGVPVEKLEKKL